MIRKTQLENKNKSRNTQEEAAKDINVSELQYSEQWNETLRYGSPEITVIDSQRPREVAACGREDTGGKFEGWDTAHWYSACPVYTKPWAPCLQPYKLAGMCIILALERLSYVHIVM